MTLQKTATTKDRGSWHRDKNTAYNSADDVCGFATALLRDMESGKFDTTDGNALLNRVRSMASRALDCQTQIERYVASRLLPEGTPGHPAPFGSPSVFTMQWTAYAKSLHRQEVTEGADPKSLAMYAERYARQAGADRVLAQHVRRRIREGGK